MNIFIEKSYTNDPYENLAYEAALAGYVSSNALQGQEIYGLFLWQNDKSIIFGRNQSIRNECNIDYAQAENVRLVRRPTGGGAVYHDLGNLNFTLISKEIGDGSNNKKINNKIIIDALDSLGIAAEVSGRNDILISNRKFSGNAYSQRDGIFVQHGTILVDLDIEKANRLLTPEINKLKSKGIKSVKGRMVNLKEIKPEIDVYTVNKAIENAFIKANPSATIIKVDELKNQIDQKLYERELETLKSEEWIDINSIKAGIKVTGDFGYFKFSIVEKSEKISKILFESDILQTELLQYIVSGLEGTPLDEDFILDRFQELRLEYPRPISDIEQRMLDQIAVAIVNSLVG